MHRAASLFVLATLAATPALAAELVHVPRFQSVELRGGGDVSIRPGSVQRVTLVEGSRQFTSFRVERNGSLKIDACNAQCPRNYSLRIEIESPSVPAVAIRGGGEIVAASGFGPQPELSAAIMGGGEINVRSVRAATVSAAINGGGTIHAGPSSSLSVAVNGGGSVRYSGNPQLNTAIVGGGSVIRSN